MVDHSKIVSPLSIHVVCGDLGLTFDDLTIVATFHATQPSTAYLSIYLKSKDYDDVGAEAQQGRLTM